MLYSILGECVPQNAMAILLVFLCFVARLATSQPTFTLAESLPVNDFDLPPIAGTLNTTAALVHLVDSAGHTLDFTAMYWSLLATSPSSRHFSPQELTALGAGSGQALYDALDRAARRGVAMRVVNGAGIGGPPTELLALQAKHPGRIQSRTWNASAWYGGGIMHQKLWVADGGAKIYLGSANMDWLSLTQVKELGVLVEDSSAARERGSALSLFNTWWKWSAMDSTQSSTRSVNQYDPSLHVTRKVPCWSGIVPAAARCVDPFSSPDLHETRAAEMESDALSDTRAAGGSRSGTSAADYQISASPQEMIGSSGAVWDLDMITKSIYAAKSTVDLSVMDVQPANMYGRDMGFVRWSQLFDAITTAAVTNGVRVCTGSIEVKQFRVPGWNRTTGSDAEYIPYSRVNHAKYVVTEQRANIGTSNWQWGYFYNTAGMSLNTPDAALVRTVQAVFDRDWASPYATQL